MANTKIPSELIDGTLGVAGISSSADATAITITSDENVGIGTASPNQDGFDANATVLSVKSANNGEGVLELIGGGNNSGDEISVINFMSQAQANPAGQIKALRNTADDEASITFSTSGAERARITATGYVGIGTASPSKLFSISGGDFSFNAGTGNLGNKYMIINAGASNDGGFILQRDNTNQWQIVNSTNDGDLLFYSYGTNSTVLNIDRSTGVIQSGTSTTAKGYNILNWAGSGYIGLTGDLTGYTAGTYSTLKANGSYIYFDIGGSYSAYMQSNGTINANSDRRLKQNIETLSTGQLDKVCNLRGVNFDWIDERATGTQVGLIAQEVQAEYPELVGDGGIEDGTLTVNYAGLVSPLIEAIKELKTKLEAAEARITELEG